MDTKQIEKLQAKIEKAKDGHKRAKWEIEQIEKEWETKYGMSSLADMKKIKEDLEEKQAGFEKELQEIVSVLDEILEKV
jgi:predicted  nucleic acid-binding Zn-ribbon protein